MVKPVTPNPPELLPGTVVNERFRIVRTAGRGGMGVVYEAIDQKLNRRVALKCMQARFLSRLPSETRAAREVSHFHVCKVYDLHSGQTEGGGIEYLSMEFIEGETLLSRIREHGPLPPAQALEIALQICAGLGQAHRQQVVHGDLKCSNVLLSQGPGKHLRAVITDFGLAHVQNDPADDAQLGGTHGYMAPEQLLGASATTASDMYALGVLFHVLITGKEPARPRANLHAGVDFPNPAEQVTASDPGSNINESTATIARAPSPEIAPADWQREIKPLPAPWKHVVSWCMAPKPADRPANCEAIANALQPRHRFWQITAAVVCLLALLFAVRQYRTVAPLQPVRLLVMPIAVEGVSGPTPERHSASTASGVALEVADRLTGARKLFTVISPREAERNQVDTLEKARAILGATHVLETRIRLSGTAFTASASLTNLQSGRRIGELEGTYASEDFQALARALAAMVAEAFRFPDKAPAETVSRAAYPDYVQGIDLLRRDNLGNADKAIPYLAKAIQLDPKSALPYAGMAEAELVKFDNGAGPEWLERAEADSAKARAISPGKVQVLLVSGSVCQMRGRYEQAIQDFIRATELGPNDSETWRRLADCYEQSNRPEDAVATYQKAIAAQPDYYRHYLSFGSFFLTRGQFSRAEEQYRQAVRVAPGLASGHMNLGVALMQQGKFSQAEAEFLATKKIRPSVALVNNLGSLYYSRERFTEAEDYYKQSLLMGNHTAVQCRNLGDAERHLGNSKEAGSAYAEARELVKQEIIRNPKQAAPHALLGLIDAYQGEAEPATFELSQALAMEPENRSVIRDSAIAYEVLGDRASALAALNKAPLPLLEELSRQPDLTKLRYDANFLDLISRERAPSKR